MQNSLNSAGLALVLQSFATGLLLTADLATGRYSAALGDTIQAINKAVAAELIFIGTTNFDRALYTGEGPLEGGRRQGGREGGRRVSREQLQYPCCCTFESQRCRIVLPASTRPLGGRQLFFVQLQAATASIFIHGPAAIAPPPLRPTAASHVPAGITHTHSCAAAVGLPGVQRVVTWNTCWRG